MSNTNFGDFIAGILMHNGQNFELADSVMQDIRQHKVDSTYLAQLGLPPEQLAEIENMCGLDTGKF